VPNLKFLAFLTVREILGGFQNSKNRSRDPRITPFDLYIAYSFVRAHRPPYPCQIWSF